ncbi:unnamed protein product (macronuclear) [Paramecium tetraurelia]|uniref:Intimal thickness related receptor IRP domain-containing protein n=1 Tax=Paramecium tetraurelia TaxID=5888 RepID=A0CE48_PARTE|nr:uncharacterized protein GSPATT00037501001 [Paramecium tetraurelia]CAK69065.1 unnamed protein product [Paramecium tetraurelia]|eukprot:XP_001436462.1 hypothetical protein (macronuclear) [Paramecium tetraurelia strain d4-2]
MLSQVSALLYVYYKDQNSDLNQERFTYYCVVIGILNFFGFILNVIEQHPKSKGNSFKLVVELICSLLGLISILCYFFYYFMEFSMPSMQMLAGLILIWVIECSLYYILSDKGLQSMLSLFVTTNVLLINGDIALKGMGYFSVIINIRKQNLFDYSSINLIVLCAQFSWAGEPTTKKTNSLFYIISRQDCFRLMVYFLLFNILNNTIKAVTENIYVIVPTLATLIPYIWATTKFSQRRYKQAFGLFLFTLVIYFPIDVYIKQQQLNQQNQQQIQL